MSIENTSNLFPEGKYTFVCNIPSKASRKGFVFWDFTFDTVLDGEMSIYQESIPIWLCAPMFRALGFPEVKPGSFDVEPTTILGKKLEGTIVHEDMKGTLRARMKDVKVIPDGSASKLEVGEGLPF